ncbi:hypothetical protein N7540_009090 [Penicillium herquei]|nr:hypothetical protein N7540_009090 [Penicillium herquei]
MASTLTLSQTTELPIQVVETRRLQQTLLSSAASTTELISFHVRKATRASEREVGNLRREKHEQATEMTKLRQRIDEYESRISALDAQILERDEKLKIFNDSIPELSEQIQTANQTISRKDNEIEDLNNRIHEQDSHLQALSASYVALEKQSMEHKNTIENHENDIGKLLGKERSSDAIILQWGPLIQKLQSQNDDKDRELRRLKEANLRNRNNVNLIEALRAENAQKDLELRCLTEENARELQASREGAENQIASLTEKLEDLNEDVKFYAKRKAHWKREALQFQNKSKGKKSRSRH